jgi:hypothetical protein
MPEGSQKVEELDFNSFAGRPITVDDLVSGMNHMGFQASSIGEAIRIINDMVSSPLFFPSELKLAESTHLHSFYAFPYMYPNSLVFHTTNSLQRPPKAPSKKKPSPPALLVF